MESDRGMHGHDYGVQIWISRAKEQAAASRWLDVCWMLG